MDNGKENGNYYNGLYIYIYIRVILGLYVDLEKKMEVTIMGYIRIVVLWLGDSSIHRSIVFYLPYLSWKSEVLIRDMVPVKLSVAIGRKCVFLFPHMSWCQGKKYQIL